MEMQAGQTHLRRRSCCIETRQDDADLVPPVRPQTAFIAFRPIQHCLSTIALQEGENSLALSSPLSASHIHAMAKSPDSRKGKDPARPTRAKAAREPLAPIAPALEKLLNPGIAKGTAGVGSGTGLKPPPDNSWDRRADFSAAHTARKSTRDQAQASPLPSPLRGGVGGGGPAGEAQSPRQTSTPLPNPPPQGG